ncbi:hypothetical protein QBC40DRAFT_61714 [Triangularia verruculosa]|uniref:Uncharacterized protein n=1 Tax=Triangularia verruculosa TaxID=2587418 RepID=A0AAN6XII4_9PEZI|nr:hypothetical protein QBC40DRAFT_61714 [Triangularia verruculosa]
MSIARAFTTRRVKQSLQTSDLNSSPQQKSPKSSLGSIRHKISSPVELIHTTNMLSYNAPDLHPLSASSTGSHRSDDDMSDSALTNGTTPPTSPDVESSPKRTMPKRAVSPEPNHLSAYFAAPGQAIEKPALKKAAPIIPQRAASHSKKSPAEVARQRSASGVSQRSQTTVSTNGSYTFSRSSSTSTATTASQSSLPLHMQQIRSRSSSAAKGSSGAAATAAADFVRMAAPPLTHRYYPPQQQPQQHKKEFSQSQHPFGQELAQVSEIAEEYGIKEQMRAVDAEEKEMVAKGLLKFNANDYLGEIQGLFANFFGDESDAVAAAMPTIMPVAAAWI